MTESDLKILLSELRSFPNETEWLEFKVNNPQGVGEYISALSNSACIHDKRFGYLVFGVEDKTHRIIVTAFNPQQKAKGNEDLVPWLARLLNPRINFEFHELQAENEKVVILCILTFIILTYYNFRESVGIALSSNTKKLEEEYKNLYKLRYEIVFKLRRF